MVEGVTSAREADRPDTVEVDAVVVGLGAGGSMVLRQLARAGLDVLGLEMGSWYRPEETSPREAEMLPELFQESGARATEDFSVSVLQGKGVGGSTIHNTNLCKRLPDGVLRHWAEHHGLDWATGESLQRDFETVEDLLNVHRVPDHRVNANNTIIESGLDELGWEGGRLKHNRHPEDCKQSGFCELGCPNDGKQNAAKVLVPQALEAGARVWTEARVEQVATRDGRATGVVGTSVDPITGQAQPEDSAFQVHADVVCVAASATGSAALIRRSDIPDPHRLAGTNLHMHPGATVVGLCDEDVESWKGNPQSVECTEFLDHTDPERPGVWLVAGAAHPVGASTFLPGFGRSHGRMMQSYPKITSMIAMLHDRSSGRIRPAADGGLHIDYSLNEPDYDALARGLRGAGRILFAGGAREVIVPTTPALRARSPEELEAIDTSDLAPFSPALAAVHPMSTLWMGDDPRTSVVDPRGQHHHVEGLWVADGSLFPTSFGGPPQIPIYTMGLRVGRAILQEHASRRSANE
jgi:choline dehydrogenase-like flavoprotein